MQHILIIEGSDTTMFNWNTTVGEKEFEYVKAILPGITIDDVNALSAKLKGQQNYFAIIIFA